MVDALSNGNTTKVSRIIKAPRSKVYQAFLDSEAVRVWLVPNNMEGHVHTFQPYKRGRFRISLQYQNPEDSRRGKTTGNMHTYQGQVIDIIPNERIVELIEFESKDPAFAGEMRMTVTLADANGGTNVSLYFENRHPGIRPEDNEEGSRQSLMKLTDLPEH